MRDISENEGGYTEKQFHNTDEIVLYYKMLCNTLIAGKGKLMPYFKVSKDRLTHLWGLTKLVTKLKPVLVYHFKNLRALKHYAKSTHPALYEWNNKV